MNTEDDFYICTDDAYDSYGLDCAYHPLHGHGRDDHDDAAGLLHDGAADPPGELLAHTRHGA